MVLRLTKEEMDRRERSVELAVQALIGHEFRDVVGMAENIHLFITGASVAGPVTSTSDNGGADDAR